MCSGVLCTWISPASVAVITKVTGLPTAASTCAPEGVTESDVTFTRTTVPGGFAFAGVGDAVIAAPSSGAVSLPADPHPEATTASGSAIAPSRTANVFKIKYLQRGTKRPVGTGSDTISSDRCGPYSRVSGIAGRRRHDATIAGRRPGGSRS